MEMVFTKRVAVQQLFYDLLIGRRIRVCQTTYFWLAYERVSENTRGADTSVRIFDEDPT